MTTQTINGAAVEIVVILADGKTDPAATLDAREAATVAAVDLARRADAAFQAAYPSAALVRVDSMRGVEETRNGRYYLRYRYAGGVTEFWGHVGQQAKIDFKKGSVGGGAGRSVALDRKRGFSRRDLASGCGGGAAFAAKRDRGGGCQHE
jgi:hypothetical protein